MKGRSFGLLNLEALLWTSGQTRQIVLYDISLSINDLCIYIFLLLSSDFLIKLSVLFLILQN